MLKIISVIAPIFLVIILGNTLKRYRLMDAQYVNTGNKLLLNVFLPVLLFNKVANSNFYEVFSLPHLLVMVCSILLIFAVSFPLAKLLKLPHSTAATFISNNFRANSTFVGLPICYYMFGDEGFTIASILLAFIVLVNNILGILVYNTRNLSIAELGKNIKATLLNPIILSCIAGILFSVLKIPIPEVLDRTFSIISGITMPIALLNIGASISLEYLKGNTKLVLISSLIKLIGLPLVAIIGFYLLHINNFGTIEKIVVILLAAPSAQVNYVLASLMDGDSNLAISGIVSSTILSAFTMVLWLHIL